MSKLTVGQWRLFLLSDCLKYYRDLWDYTYQLRRQGKMAVLEGVNKLQAEELDIFLSEEDVDKVLYHIKKEWKFSGKVLDHGSADYTCDYCQHQQIRYKYLCVNEVNKTWLSLGSVCVGNIIHGEHAMKDKSFSDKFVKDLEKMKGRATLQQQEEDKKKEESKYHPLNNNNSQSNITADELKQKRVDQHNRIKSHTEFLKKYFPNSDFLISLENRWKSGMLLTVKQEKALIDWSIREQKKREKTM